MRKLNKETIAKLTDDQQKSIYGGGYDTGVDGCLSRAYCPAQTRDYACPDKTKPVDTLGGVCLTAPSPVGLC